MFKYTRTDRKATVKARRNNDGVAGHQGGDRKNLQFFIHIKRKNQKKKDWCKKNTDENRFSFPNYYKEWLRRGGVGQCK